jgi:hypothetical protein
MFHIRGPLLGFLKLFHVVITVARGDIPKSVALVLEVNKLLTMAKDINGLRPIIVGEVFF